MGAVLDGYCRRMSPTASGIGYELSRTFSASPDALFDALTSATVLKCMWGVQEIDVDARVGGRAVAVYVADGQDWSFTITYNELARDKGRLSWVARFKSFPSKETRVAVQLTPVNGGTALTLRMENFESAEECNANRQAWERGLAILADVLGEQAGQ
jgi:uncharacterized protein YndB with AHSA1/START domain